AIPEAAAPEVWARHDPGAGQTAHALGTPAWTVPGAPDVEDEAGEVVLGYCAAVRGILNDDQGGPLHPPGVRMSEALQEVRASLELTFRPLFRTSEAILGKPPVARGGGTLGRLLHDL